MPAIGVGQVAEVEFRRDRSSRRGPRGAAQMRGNGPSENGDQHVERQKDLRQTDPDKQHLLELPEASDETENVIEVHFS